MTTKVTMVLDLQYGSTGKGLICGYLAEQGGYDGAITANMPNAGHTYISRNGRKTMFKTLPIGAVAEGVKKAFIGPGAVFNVDRLREEYQHALVSNPNLQLIIHPNATVLMGTHREEEANSLNDIASTMQGSMAATVHKMRRRVIGSPLARHQLAGSDFDWRVVSHDDWISELASCKRILAEGSQGYSLGIDTAFYPYTTSRNCTPHAFWSAMGLPWRRFYMEEVIGTVRTYPIRVGSTPGGYSGPCYPDQHEVTWEEIGQTPELTTVTQRVRRVFTYSKQQIEEAVAYCAPSGFFLNFCNYAPASYLEDIYADLRRHTWIRYSGWGPAFHDVRHGVYGS